MNRRKFICLSSAALAGTSYVGAAEEKKPELKLALSQYSLRKLFFSKELSPDDFPAYTRDQFGISAIDLWEGGLAKDKRDNEKYLSSLRKKAADAKSDLYLLMTGTLVVAANAKDMNYAKNGPVIEQSIWRAKILGANFLRIFMSAPNMVEEAKAVEMCVEALKPLAEKAQESKVMLVIEPGTASKLSRNGAFLAKVAAKLNHPGCKLMPDFGKLKGDIYAGTEAMMPFAASVSCKMHNFDDKGNQPDYFDYQKLLKIVVESKFKGYLAIEWEGRKLAPVEGVKASKKLIQATLTGLGVSI